MYSKSKSIIMSSLILPLVLSCWIQKGLLNFLKLYLKKKIRSTEVRYRPSHENGENIEGLPNKRIIMDFRLIPMWSVEWKIGLIQEPLAFTREVFQVQLVRETFFNLRIDKTLIRSWILECHSVKAKLVTNVLRCLERGPTRKIKM